MSQPPLRGRTAVFADARRLLADPGERLLTLTGLAGVGKSRVSAHLVATMSPGPGPVVRVEADEGFEPGLLTRKIRVAAGLPTPFPPGQKAPGVPQPTRRPPLLVLVDDAHRAPDTATTLRQLLAERDDVRFLVTSRAPLRLPGESVLRVEPFPVPDPDDDLPEDLARHPAVQLFTDVAVATGTTVRMEGTALVHVARLCARLGGLPLAIELAAARSAAFSPATLLELLDRSSPMELFGRRTASSGAAGHDLLHAIGWSESLLDDSQRRLLRDLTVFQSPVPVDAIAAVAGRADIVDDLSALVDVHLVDPDHRSGTSRFSLHPLVREQARRALADESPTRTAELATAHERWAADYAAWTEQADAAGLQTRVAELVAPVEPDLRLALHRALDAGHGGPAVRLTLGLAPYWFIRGTPSGHTDLIGRVASLPEVRHGDPGDRALLAGWYGLLRSGEAQWTEQVDDMAADMQAAVALSRQAGDAVLLRVLCLCVLASRVMGRRESILPLCVEGRELARTLGQDRTLTRFEIWSGMLAHQSGDLEGSSRWGRTAYERARHFYDPALLLTAVGFLRSLPGGSADVPGLPDHEELVETARRTNNRYAQAWLQPIAAMTALAAGDLKVAADHAAEVITLARASGVWGWCGTPMMVLACIATARGDEEQAARLHGMISPHLPVLGPGMAPWALAAYEGSLEAARERWHDDGFESAFFAGSSTTYLAGAEEALAFARAVTSRVPAPPRRNVVGQRLTAREQQVLSRLVIGETNKEISVALGISAKTVMHHTSSIYRKLEVRGRAQAVAWQLGRGHDTTGVPASR